MNKDDFIKGVEKLVNPVDVGTLHFIQKFNNYVPLKIQKKMVDASSKITPYMGFVVEPYSYFLCYELKDLDVASTFLPQGFRLVKTRIFQEDEAKYYGIFGAFNAHTSGFWGLRLEFYIIAEHIESGLLSWVIADYDTNTITYDPKHGLSDANAKGSIMTIDYGGQLYAEICNDEGRTMIFNSDTKAGILTPLDERLWVEGNLSVAYGSQKSNDDPGVFSLIFDAKEFEKALRIPKASLTVEVNNWFPGLFEEEPSEIVCFPYAQHFLSDSPGHASHLRDKHELSQAVAHTDFKAIAPFSTEGFKKSFLLGGLVSFAINLTLLILLIMNL